MYIVSFAPFNNYLKAEYLSLVFNFTDEKTDSKDLPQNHTRSYDLAYGNNIPWSHNLNFFPSQHNSSFII